MLSEWVTPNNVLEHTSYSLHQYTEHAVIPDTIDSLLAHTLASHLIDPEFLTHAQQHLGWLSLDKLIQGHYPTRLTLQRGSFGEVISTSIIEEFLGHVVPIRKLRFRILPNDSLHGTDVLAIQLNPQGRLASVLYVESKVRTTRSDQADLARAAVEQLARDCNTEQPAIIVFAAKILFDKGSLLADALLWYLADRSSINIDSHHVVIVADIDHWRETDLECLEDEPLPLQHPTIHLVQVKSLGNRIDRVFALLQIEASSNDD